MSEELERARQEADRLNGIESLYMGAIDERDVYKFEFDKALSRIARVEALHQPDSVLSDYCEECSDFGTDSHPVGEFIEYPCPTVRALTEGEPDAQV